MIPKLASSEKLYGTKVDRIIFDEIIDLKKLYGFFPELPYLDTTVLQELLNENNNTKTNS